MKIKTKLTLFYTAGTSVILVCFGLLLYFGMQVILFSEIDRELASTAERVVQSNGNEFTLFNFIDAKLAGLKENTEMGVVLLDSEGKAVFETEIAKKMHVNPGSLKMRKTVNFMNYKIETLHQNVNMKRADGTELAGNYRILVKQFFYRNVPLGWIQISQPIDDIMTRLKQLRKGIFFLFPFILVITALTGYFLAARSLSPIQSIISSAGRIHDSNLSERIPAPGTHDELHTLISTLNGLFDRLEESFNSQKQFISDAAHELKTPLAILRTGLETEICNETVDERVRTKLTQNVETISRLTTLVEKLLFLSRLENRKVTLKQEEIDLAEMAGRIRDDLGPLLDEKRQTFNLDAPGERMSVRGDRDLIYQAVFNIINNAMKYTPAGGAIRVVIGNSGNDRSIAVSDNGIGMTAEELGNAFKRFYRADKSRTEEKGYGLGLSITRWILALHGGRISIESVAGKGTSVTMVLPA